MRRDPRLLFVLLLAFSSPALAQPVVHVSAADWIVEGDQPTRTFGAGVAAGDIDGDGYDDLLIGDPFFDGAFDNSGRITIHRGSAAGLSPVPDWSVEGAQDERLGSVFPAGDVNGDGFDDFIVFDTFTSVLQLMLGSPAGPSERTPLVRGLYRGHGDVNGDGFSDIGVLDSLASPRFPRPSSEQPDLLPNLTPSKVHLFMGSASGLPASPSASLTPAPRAGWVFESTFEDLNGDGYSDLVVGWGGGFSQRGGFSIYLGSGEGLRTRSKRIIDFRENVGLDLSAAGDVNGDGFGDLAVRTGYSNELASFATLLLFWGSATGIRTQPQQVASFAEEFLGFIQFKGAGDLNGDGFGDLMIRDGSDFFGAPVQVKLLSGSASGSHPLTLTIHNGEISTASSAGDVNGDGYGDIVISVRGAFGEPGRVYVFYGEPSP